MDDKQLASILQASQYSNCRFPIVLSGEQSWCISTLLSLKLIRHSENAIFVSSQATLEGFNCIPANKVKGLLGRECELLVWDGFSGFHPDALGAATGLLKGGGVFVFIVPQFEDLVNSPDPDYQRMCANEEELKHVNTYFLQRLKHFFARSECFLFEQNSNLRTALTIPETKTANQVLPTPDQEQTIDSIMHVVEGHRRRPLVITADRGRGKSSALGIAAAKVVLKYNKDVLLTAPSKRACEQVFQHFGKTISDLGYSPDDYTQKLQFIAPDELLNTKPSCQLLMIDEAAGIAAPLLTELLKHYSRIVFSTTIHGYEGNGQGFAIRFRKQLDLLSPDWKSIHLNIPVRWSENDPLENWISDLLFLSLNSSSFKSEKNEKLLPTEFIVKWHTQEELATQPGLLDQVITLLVNAHYQTSPDDIRLILDHPGIHVACGYVKLSNSLEDITLISAMLLISEGQITNQELQNNILNGNRRLRGHLVPQSLATFSGNKSLLESCSLRVMRIAVQAKFKNQGFGSKLLEAAYHYADKLDFDYLSTAFGLTSELLSFWRKNQFLLLKLGIQRDNASACYTAIMARPLNEKAKSQTIELQQLFAQQLYTGISRQYRGHSTNTLLDTINATQFVEKDVYLDEKQLTKLRRFATANLSIEECMDELTKLMFNYLSRGLVGKLDKTKQLLLVSRILQAHSVSTCVEELELTGKKELDKKLRRAVSAILSEFN